ncbi:AraC family transcriptional regulator [Nitrococcus mobilis]|uniref:Transcriptional regulator, AraC family protein n=1 Tax=Nitrococcus mobilis Nb-231 TaxID=314278 RepID=A4BUH5_9GAMM|nr:AraC family transcriptional regulator [Nitrococcus mobilis]EAR20689.1 transcriptional regulator, AraC family protein [Nitrococcus mobilis Nb-231]
MVDRLASLLNRFELRARVFNSGPLCSAATFDAVDGVGHIHVLLRGALRVETAGEATFEINTPTLLFYMRPTTHHLAPSRPEGAETVCGSIDFGAGAENPLARALPRLLVIPLAELEMLSRTIELLFEEAFESRCGRQAALDRLCELLTIQLFRYLMDRDQVDVGLLAGLADPRLAKALNAIHEDPADQWTLERLAERAGMSRARFAARFRATIGATPGEYLAHWRLGLAQALLRRGKPVAIVAHAVGYSGPAALARAFKARFDASPLDWLKQTRTEAAQDSPREAFRPGRITHHRARL